MGCISTHEHENGCEEEKKTQEGLELPRKISKIMNTTTATLNDTENYSKDNSDGYVIFEVGEEKKMIGINDIDLLDLPLSGSMVALAGSINEMSNSFQRIDIQTLRISKLIYNKCTFCMGKLNENIRIVELPCKHFLHYECIKKWIVISNPCKKCHL